MREIVSIAVIALVWSVTTNTALAVEVSNEPALLATYPFRTNGGGAPETDPRVELILQLPTNFPPTDFFGLGQGLDLFWEDGELGSFDFTSVNDAGFDDFANFATDGLDDLFALYTLFPSGGGDGDFGAETELFGGVADLVGFNLELVRLVVDEASVTPWFPDPINEPELSGFKFDISGSYEFYGSVIPEPGAIWLGLFGTLLLLSRRQPG
jgi:hypothetical protein